MIIAPGKVERSSDVYFYYIDSNNLDWYYSPTPADSKSPLTETLK